MARTLHEVCYNLLVRSDCKAPERSSEVIWDMLSLPGCFLECTNIHKRPWQANKGAATDVPGCLAARRRW